MSIYIVHCRRKASNAPVTLVLSEQMFSTNIWKTCHYRSAESTFQVICPATVKDRQQVSGVDNAAQKVGDDCQSIVAVY